jgi:DNA (cytosine-5)-methyltransferase 1
MRTVAFCEIDPYCRAVLAKHWPGVPIHDDVRTLTGAQVGSVDVICGGFPCQDVSLAGARAGLGAERSGLWSEYARLIRDLRPRYAVVENTPGLLSLGMGTVLGDLAEVGYDAEWHCIPASAVGADHQRDRVWIIAHPNGTRVQSYVKRGRKPCTAKVGQDAADTYGTRELQPERFEQKQRRRTSDSSEAHDAYPDSARYEGVGETGTESAHVGNFGAWIRSSFDPARCISGEHWNHKPVLGRGVHGIPNRLDRIGALGNAVVPQIVEIIGRAIMQASQSKSPEQS